MNCNNHISLILFTSLLGIFIFLLIKWIYNIIINNIYEYFENKRNIKINILKSDESLDPDENTTNDEYEIDDQNMQSIIFKNEL